MIRELLRQGKLQKNDYGYFQVQSSVFNSIWESSSLQTLPKSRGHKFKTPTVRLANGKLTGRKRAPAGGSETAARMVQRPPQQGSGVSSRCASPRAAQSVQHELCRVRSTTQQQIDRYFQK